MHDPNAYFKHVGNLAFSFDEKARYPLLIMKGEQVIARFDAQQTQQLFAFLTLRMPASRRDGDHP